MSRASLCKPPEASAGRWSAAAVRGIENGLAHAHGSVHSMVDDGGRAGASRMSPVTLYRACAGQRRCGASKVSLCTPVGACAGQCRAAAARSVEKEPAHTHGSVHRAAEGGSGAGHQKPARTRSMERA
ncbi:hypothetical protein GGX14DRAFT_400590 [Mycena pura]|uniref:Uncharacterized protein n=1 Tax=Mycena pura TaxID=153505 RepID=A0AAD6V2M9_9AGAR|nr:hypothetical protein GGX14DRAFT_400590 [Mycena pura]